MICLVKINLQLGVFGYTILHEPTHAYARHHGKFTTSGSFGGIAGLTHQFDGCFDVSAGFSHPCRQKQPLGTGNRVGLLGGGVGTGLVVFADEEQIIAPQINQ